MKKKQKIMLLSIGIFLTFALIVGLSYAYYMFNVSQSGTNALRTNCFKLTFTDRNDINLNNAIPMSDSEIDNLVPYEFSISNVCGIMAAFNVNVETLNNSDMNLNAISYTINGRNPNVLGSLEEVDPEFYVNDNVKSSKTIDNGIIRPGQTKNFTIKFWINEDATVEQSASKIFESKIVVTSTMSNSPAVAMLKTGNEVNASLKSLLDQFPEREIGEGYDVYPYRPEINSIVRSSTAPDISDEYINIADDDSAYPIYAWATIDLETSYYHYYDDEFYNPVTIHLYTEDNKIYMNPDSSYLFSEIHLVGNLDMSIFDSRYVTNMSYMFSYINPQVNRTYATYNIDLSTLNTSKVTDMSGMFYDDSISSLDLSSFDTSNVENMSEMFYGMNIISTLDVSNFNTSKVKDMSYMFENVRKVTELDVSNFDTSNVENMSFMFDGFVSAGSEDPYGDLTNLIGIENFNTSKVKDMSYMFSDLALSSIDISHFDTSNVENMAYMFHNMINLTSLTFGNDFDTSKVTNMSGMFSRDRGFTSIDLSRFNTSNVTKMNSMFSGMSNLASLDLSNFDTSKVTDMSSMFSRLSSLTSFNFNLNTSSVEDMSYMFYNDKKLTNLTFGSNVNTSNVTKMSNMFNYSSKLTTLDLSNFDTSNVTKMDNMFSDMDSIQTLDLSSFNTSNVTVMRYMFSSDYNLTTIYVGSGWSTANLASDSGYSWNAGSTNMFSGDTRLVGGSNTTYTSSYKDKTYAKIDCGISSPGYLTYKGPLGTNAAYCASI